MMAEEGRTEGPRVRARYSRLLDLPEGPMSRARREASAATRICLEGLRFRFAEPDALFVIDIMLRLGEVGTFDLEGSLRKIGGQIGELLGKQPEHERFYRGMRALAGRTCLVERVSRQIWRLSMAGITDPSSPRHRRLLEETPSPCRLEVAQRREDAEQPEPIDTERQGEHVEHDAISAEFVALRDEVKRLADVADALRHERDTQLVRADGLAAEHRQLEERLLEREIEVEALERQLAALRDQQAAPVEPDKLKALKATLKSEREKRKAAEIRLRRLLSALKVKLEGVGDVPGDIELDRILWASLEATFAEHLDALVAEEDDPELEPGREVELRADAELTRALILRVRM